ncbi:hypothetical protein HDU96_009557 [Phlyctochytrium bullatum]|nr:hypothetical protein HDU96_009557 [Phlyctochytrium bullatum]
MAAVAAAPSDADKNFLSVTDPLTNKTIKIPISAQGTIPASLFTGLRIKQTTPPSDNDADTVPLRLYDPGFKNTVVCRSKISEVDGENGNLYYRGYDVTELVENSSYLEVAYLLINGEMPTKAQYDNWTKSVMMHTYLHTEIERQMLTFRYDSHPMGMLIATIASLSTFHPDANPALQGDGLYMLPKVPADRQPTPVEASKISSAKMARLRAIYRMLGKVPTVAANAYRHRIGREYNPPMKDCTNYAENLLYMMDKLNEENYKPDPRLVRILDKIFILLAEHGSNCSTVMMRHLASSGVDPYTALSGASGALFGERKASAVIGMLRQIGKVENIQIFLSLVKRKQTFSGSVLDQGGSSSTASSRARPTRLMGFGHRIYKTHDPRVKICKGLALELFELMGKGDLGELALALEEAALNDEWFTKRGLYPNIDYWTAIVFHTLGFPPDMFPVLICVPRVAGFIAHWQESLDDPEYKIYRPRQIYVGEHHRPFEHRVDPPTAFAAGSGPAKTGKDGTSPTKPAAAATPAAANPTSPTGLAEPADLEATYVKSDPVAAKRRTKTFSTPADAAALAQLAELIRHEDKVASSATSGVPPTVGEEAEDGEFNTVASRLSLGPVSSWIVKNLFYGQTPPPTIQPPKPAVPKVPQVSPPANEDPAETAKRLAERLAKTQAEMRALMEEQQRLAAKVASTAAPASSNEGLGAPATVPTGRPISPNPIRGLSGSHPDLLAGSRSPRVLNKSATAEKK